MSSCIHSFIRSFIHPNRSRERDRDVIRAIELGSNRIESRSRSIGERTNRESIIFNRFSSR